VFHVFNADQCEGLEELKRAPSDPIDPITACDELVAAYVTTGPSVNHGGYRAYYSPARDSIGMPNRDDFESAEHYYSTLFHELTHSTGHASRLNRETLTEGHAFGDAEYSREELIAELGAAMLCAIAGIDNAAVTNSSAAYLSHWVRVLKGDHKLIVSAAAHAQRAADMISRGLGVTLCDTDGGDATGDKAEGVAA
jgi:antirestriction protein ArdC